MPDAAELKELEKNRRLSLLHMRRGAIILGCTGLALFVLQQFISIRLWIPFVILAILSLTVLGDAINYFRCDRRLRKLQQDKVG
jgi:hypothetical protein